ncbi:MAG: acyltransferase family protein [Mucilaginibacter sp.]|uniref:acyltransferase family protein n=1 Tax=Mucilaginibacter sp. TaxID=1882438 RepID=UPI0032633331
MQSVTDSKAPTKYKWISGLDSIRFILALIVLLSHYPNPFLSFKDSHSLFLRIIPSISNVFYNGAAAVITFFIISGFVIHYPNRNKTSLNVVSFLIRRVIRIGIPLIIVELIGIYYKHQDLIPIWSLYCELIYYICYPLLFMIKISWTRKFQISFVIGLIIAVAFNYQSILSAFYHRDINYMGDYWYLGTLLTAVLGLPCWLLGVLLAERIDSLDYEISFITIMKYRIGVLFISIILLIVMFHFYISYIFTFNIFALLLVKWLEKEIVYYKTHNCSRILEYMGKFSYSLYLTHGLLRIFISLLIPYELATYLVYIVLAIFISYIIYLLIEYPSHKIAQSLSKWSDKLLAKKVISGNRSLLL